MHTKKDIKCPFCHTVYSEVEEKARDKKGLQKLEKNFSKFGKIIIKKM